MTSSTTGHGSAPSAMVVDMSTNTHTPIVLAENADGWTVDGGTVYSPACTCGMVPGRHYRTADEATRRAWHDLPRSCKQAGVPSVVTHLSHGLRCAGCVDAVDHAHGILASTGSTSARASVHAGGGATHTASIVRGV